MKIIEGVIRPRYQFPSQRPKTTRRHHPPTLEGILAHTLPPNKRGCRLWKGQVDSAGYGRKRIEGKLVRVHRLVWQLVNGPISNLVRHTCDVPACCEPTHLLPGSHADNARDKVLRGRSRLPKGFRSKLSKLTPRQVKVILQNKPSVRARRGSRIAETLSRKFGISEAVVYRVWKGVSYSCL